MKQKYRYGTKKYISPAESFGFRVKILVVFTLVVLVGGGIFLYDWATNDNKPQTPTSPTVIKPVSFDTKYFSSPYFRFTDSGNWEFIQSQSATNKYVFQKYLPNSTLVQHQLIVYINTTPPPLELAASRVLPIQINDGGNGFKLGEVSGHCGKMYGAGEPHRVQLRQISGATMLCDPDQAQLRVVLAKSGGNYNLKLKRSDGSFADYVIIYQNQKLDPDTSTIEQVAGSFQAI
jgi:hypothetical protein